MNFGYLVKNNNEIYIENAKVIISIQEKTSSDIRFTGARTFNPGKYVNYNFINQNITLSLSVYDSELSEKLKYKREITENIHFEFNGNYVSLYDLSQLGDKIELSKNTSLAITLNLLPSSSFIELHIRLADNTKNIDSLDYEFKVNVLNLDTNESIEVI